ncbi:MAG: 2-C-methyl-D-erythritol 4-phosphate cytidylyltransferase [Candidatus Nanopelagicaceae bacterium]|nr:2-C-methyl-D-erythritol 4-phosphate cytidylyltransferase [Candidatus Nanopelagicaceae bacterium]
MRPSFRLVLAVTSSTALLEVNKTPSMIRAIHGLQDFWPTLPLTIAVDVEHSPLVTELLEKNRVSHELLICNPCDPHALAVALAPESRICDAFIIHDASRPLTSPDQFSRIVEALTDSVDAVRPAIAFTETLKIIESGSIIKKTLDRTSVRRISTPELIRTSAVDSKGKDRGWFLPLKKDARTEHVEGTPEALRINSVGERDLLESFLHWRQTSV